MRRMWLVVIAAIIILAASLTTDVLFKAVKIGDEARLTGVVSFEESLDVAAFWPDVVLEVRENAVDLAAFLTESDGDLARLARRHGRYTMGTSGNLNYAVSGTATVTAVNTRSKAGTITLRLTGYDGPVEVQVQIGEVFKEMSIRDYVSFININDYADQIQYAQLAKSINRHVLEEVIRPVEVETLLGETLRFWGCFTRRGNNRVVITPVALERAGGGA